MCQWSWPSRHPSARCRRRAGLLDRLCADAAGWMFARDPPPRADRAPVCRDRRSRRRSLPEFSCPPQRPYAVWSRPSRPLAVGRGLWAHHQCDAWTERAPRVASRFPECHGEQLRATSGSRQQHRHGVLRPAPTPRARPRAHRSGASSEPAAPTPLPRRLSLGKYARIEPWRPASARRPTCPWR